MRNGNPLTRRGYLASAAALSICSAFARPTWAAPARPGKAKSVIMIFNCGAPSHLDLWDPKPKAGTDVRGEFQTISTNVPGIQVTELLPRLATRLDKLAIVRSVHHSQSSHNAGMYWATVGRPYAIDSTLINPSRDDIPCFGTLAGWLAQRDGFSRDVPPYVITPFPHCDSKAYITPGQYGGCLGPSYDPFVLNDDPNAKQFKVRDLALDPSLISHEKLRDRLQLLQQLNQPNSRSHLLHTVDTQQLDLLNRQAVSLLESGRAGQAFDLTQESDATREMYGRHSWGQSHLLARRLIEAGSRFVTTVNGPSITWDTHKDNFNTMKKRLVPPMEQAYAALLDDLEQRGLLESTLVIWMGEFGRTPKINNEAGRDHWPGCYSVVLAGGGIRGGQVVGESDKIGAYPKQRPITPADIHATVFSAMGYDVANITYPSIDGRPIPLSDGQPIMELL